MLIMFLVVILVACQEKTADQESERSYSFRLLGEDQLLADIHDLRNKLDTTHFNLYHKHSKAEFDSVFRMLETDLSDSMDQAQFFLHLLPVFEMMEDAHSALIFPFNYSEEFSEQGGRFIPLKFFIKDETIYVKENLADQEVPLYSTVKAINGKVSSEILEDLHMIWNPEIPEGEDGSMAYFLPHLLYPLYEFDSVFHVELETLQGQKFVIALEGIALNEIPKNKRPDFEFRSPEYGIGLLTINRCEDKEGFASFCDSVFSVMQVEKYTDLIIDVRDNGGGSTFHGDTLFTYITDRKFSQYPKVEMKLSPYSRPGLDSVYNVMYDSDLEHAVDNPKRFTGEVYLLQNIESYSSASVLAATFQCYNMGITVGQETGGVQVFFDEPILLELPNSGLQFLASYQLRWCPCGTETHRGIIPDHIVEWNIQNEVDGIDTELEFTLDLIRIKADQ